MSNMSSLLYLWLAVFILVSDAVTVPARAAPFGPNIARYAVGPLPGVHYKLPASWAGSIGISGTRDNELFFWLSEAENVSGSENLIIWLNGGPGCSSLQGLTFENGPLAFYGNATVPAPNRYSWTKLANVLYIDQPVGTGFSTGSDQAINNAQVTEQFYTWLQAFYAIFPGLKSKKTYLIGESYAGVYIPYFTQAILANASGLSINLQSITIGNPAFGDFPAMDNIPITTYMHEQNQVLHIPQDVLDVFDRANVQCKYDQVMRNFTYPPGNLTIPTNPTDPNLPSDDATCNRLAMPTTAAQVNASIYSQCFNNQTCATWFAAVTYLNATRPCFDVYNIGHNCRTQTHIEGIVAYFNGPAVRTAIHAPNKTVVACNQTILETLSPEEIEAPAHAIIPNILEQGVAVHIYSGDYDFLLNHIGTELVIQNMTWCSKQGLQSPPNNTFYVEGKPAGNWGSGRNLSYHRIHRSGHQVPHDRPAAAFAYVRDFVVGNVGFHA